MALPGHLVGRREQLSRRRRRNRFGRTPSDEPSCRGRCQLARAVRLTVTVLRWRGHHADAVEQEQTTGRAQGLPDGVDARGRQGDAVGITGGARGRSSRRTIEALGMYLIEQGTGRRAQPVDPSSDKDRRSNPRRQGEDGGGLPFTPMPTSGRPPDVGQLAEWRRPPGNDRGSQRRGLDVALVETVGVGQSEVTVANMVDPFVFLTLARTGDQLQASRRASWNWPTSSWSTRQMASTP